MNKIEIDIKKIPDERLKEKFRDWWRKSYSDLLIYGEIDEEIDEEIIGYIIKIIEGEIKNANME